MSSVHGGAPEYLVLVVDDSAEIRTLFEIGLSESGYAVMTAATIDQAFDLVRQHRPDVLLTDMMLGEESGLDLITRIRGDLAPPLPAIIAISGFPDFEDDALRRGAGAFLSKPVSLDNLLAHLAAAAEGRPVEPELSAAARSSSSTLRRKVVEAADSLMSRIDWEGRDIQKRTTRVTRWMSEYFGFGTFAASFVHHGQLLIEASSDESLVPPGRPTDELLPFARDILEASSNLLLADAARYVPQGTRIRPQFFVGVPVYAPDGTPIGSFCLFDSQRRPFDGEDLAILEMLGRRATMILTEEADQIPRVRHLYDRGMIARELFDALLELELRRARRHDLLVDLLVANVERSEPRHDWEAVLQERIGTERVLVSERDPGQVSIAITRPEGEAHGSDMAALIELVRETWGLRSGGAISVGGRDLHALGQQVLLHLSESLAREQAGSTTGEVEWIVLRRARPLAPSPPSPESPADQP